MIRRCVNIAVMFGCLANQLAAVPHAHAEGFQHDHHSSQPHVHLSWFGGAHQDHEHHRHRGPAANKHEHSLTHAALGRGATDDHDDDAIYSSPAVARDSSGNDNTIGWLKWQTTNIWQSVAIANKAVADIPSLALRERPPVLTGEHCALFLKLRTLRI